MISVGRLVGYNSLGQIDLVDVPIDSLTIYEPCALAIDGSTKVTGVGFIGLTNGAIFGTAYFERKDETPVEYKVRLKQKIYEILQRSRCITDVYYEEPFIGLCRCG